MKKNRKPRRGSVIMLVVGVLALLAVMGTVYIVSARVERGTTRATTEATQMDMAQDAVIQQVRQLLFDQAPAVRTWQRYTYSTNGGEITQNAVSYQLGEIVQSPADSAWNATFRYFQCISGYTTDAGSSAPAGDATHWSQLVAGLEVSPPRFFDYPEIQANAPFGSVKSADGSILYRDQPLLSLNLFAQANDTDYSRLTQNAYNPATGNFDIDPISNGYFADAVGDPNHSILHDPLYLLPFSSANNIHYRVALRMIDTNRMVNLNTGSAAAPPPPAGDQGQYLSSVLLAAPSIFNSGDTVGALDQNDSTLPRRYLGSQTRAEMDWQSLRLETIHQSSTGNTNNVLRPFDLSDEIELRTRGVYGGNYIARPAMQGMWPMTLGAGKATRQYYSTVTWDRDLRRLPDPLLTFTLTVPSPTNPSQPSVTSYIWPQWPQKIAVNFPLSVTNNTLDYNSSVMLASMATNLATLMENMGYQHEEACYFALNCMMARYNGSCWASGVYSAPGGPSFIDDKGICLRACEVKNDGSYIAHMFNFGPSRGGSNTDLHNSAVPLGNTASAPTTARCFFGYLAQPFINEVSVIVSKPQEDQPLVTKEQAIELVNPYPFPLDLTGWKLYIAGVSDANNTIELKNLKFGSNPLGVIPAHGIVVIYKGDTIASGITESAQANFVIDANQADMTVRLTRPYIDRAGTFHDLVVDVFGYASLYDGLDALTGDKSVSLGRANKDETGLSPVPAFGDVVEDWGCAVAGDPVLQENPSLGRRNQPDGEGARGRLLDRFAYSNLAQGAAFESMAELGQIMRLGHRQDISGNDAADMLSAVPVTHFMWNNSDVTGNLSFMNNIPGSEQAEAKIYLDFYAPPSFFDSTTFTPSDFDYRAVRMLEYIAWIDRVSDGSIDNGSGLANDIDKLRIPGRINVNTAPRPGLDAIVQGVQTVNNRAKIAQNIESYRKREGTLVSLYGGATRSPSSTTRGIRSMAELLTAINGGARPENTSLATYYQDWAQLYTFTTVRSDVFVLYGYMEAIQMNPAYSSGGNLHNNGTDWYGAADENPNANIPNKLLSRRRFLAIIDRSWCNAPRGGTDVNHPFRLPRILAVKEIPVQ